LNKHIGIRKSENSLIALYNNNDIELNYDNMDYYMKQEIENELGKDVYAKLAQILSKHNSEIYHFDYEKIEKCIREELNTSCKDIVDNAILKVPDVYCILIKEKVI
jgi:hypothetical protein